VLHRCDDHFLIRSTPVSVITTPTLSSVSSTACRLDAATKLADRGASVSVRQFYRPSRSKLGEFDRLTAITSDI
jgi:hypothetical protein